jgi:hypothetical protein
MLTVLGGIAAFERDLILQRTNGGRMRAAEGTRFGRRPKLTKHQAGEALKRVAAGETPREIALSYNVDHSTIVARGDLQRRPRWRGAFANERKDHRYYELVEDTLHPEFDYRYFVFKDTGLCRTALFPAGPGYVGRGEPAVWRTHRRHSSDVATPDASTHANVGVRRR